MKKYEIINLKGLDWYVIDIIGDKVKLLLKDVLDGERIEKYADDDFMYNGHDVRHQDHIREFDWEKSYIKNTILPNFLEDLEVDGKIDLLSKEEVESLPDEIRKCNDWYWTKSRRSDYTTYAFFVTYAGYVGYNNVRIGRGVRPSLLLSNISQFLTGEVKAKSCKEKIEQIEMLLGEIKEELE